MIESYEIKESGYHPFLIRMSWLVYKSNYIATHHLDAIKSLDTHHETDEVFILVKDHTVISTTAVSKKKVDF